MANQIEGSVVEIGPTGSLICDISAAQLAGVPSDENTVVTFGDHKTQGLFPTGHGQPESTMVAFVGTSDRLEIEIVGVSLSEMLGISPGEKVSVAW